MNVMISIIALSLNLGTLIVIGIILMCIYPNECIKETDTMVVESSDDVRTKY